MAQRRRKVAQSQQQRSHAAHIKAITKRRAVPPHQVIKTQTIEPPQTVEVIVRRLLTRAANAENDHEIELASDVRRAITLIRRLDAELSEALRMLNGTARLSAITRPPENEKRSHHAADGGY